MLPVNYKRYLVTHSPFDQLYRISKNGSHIATAPTMEVARVYIDQLTHKELVR